MADGAGVEYEDILVINCCGCRLGAPGRFCSGCRQGRRKDGKTVVGVNFDFMSDPFAYRVVIVAHPSFGNSYISTGGPARWRKFCMNEKGLVETNHHGEYVRPQDKAFGIPAFVMPLYNHEK